MKSFSLQQWVVGIASAAALAIVGLAAVSWNLSQQTLAASAFVSHTHEVISAIKNAESSLYRAEAAQRGFLAARGAAFLAERDAALQQLDAGIGELTRLTLDNPIQQSSLVDLRRDLAARIEVYHRTETPDDDRTVEERLAEGARVLARIGPRFQTLAAEEQRLLRERESVEADRSRGAALSFAVLIGALVLLLPLGFWRLRNDLQARRLAEEEVSGARAYDDSHARALTLYNAEPSRAGVIDGTLALLAEHRLFAASAFYAHEELGGELRLEASHAAPADTARTLRLGEGAVGAVARTHKPLLLDRLGGTGAGAGEGLAIVTGLATLQPAALLISPVAYQNHLLGVLVLATSVVPTERDRQFVERLCAQFAVALHNVGQVHELGLLADELRRRGEDIQRKNAELEKASRMKSEFLANMSHELRTPLNAVIGFSEIIKDGLTGPLTPEQSEYITDIHGSGKHLLALINDILDLSKVESGHMPLELDWVEPMQIATSGASVMREKAANAHITLNTVCDPQLSKVQVDVRKAKQIVYNLLSNAVKFTPEGGSVALVVKRVAREEVASAGEAAEARFFAPTMDCEAYLELRVTDSGIGIARDGLQQLFSPFVQIDSSLSRKYQGTGLGLSLVRQLAELHGGGLMARSVPGQGSSFSVWLPWRPCGDSQAATVTADMHRAPARFPPPAEAGGPLILIVEDDAATARALRQQLQAEGYRVAVAANAEDGLVQAQSAQPAVIVLDIILPGIDGWQMLQRLKNDPATQALPVVVVSVTNEAQRGFMLGASQVLNKPVAPSELLDAVAAAGFDERTPGARVLVIDDDPRAVTLVGRHLESAGFVAISAFSGQEGVEAAINHRPALIILDLMMPELSGFDVLQALRERPDTAGIPVIVLTAQILSPQERALLRGKVQQVIEKSQFQPASLLAEIRRVLVRQRGAAPVDGGG